MHKINPKVFCPNFGVHFKRLKKALFIEPSQKENDPIFIFGSFSLMYKLIFLQVLRKCNYFT